MIPERNKLYCGDTYKIIKQWNTEFVDLIITSPPYWRARRYMLFDHREIGFHQTYSSYLKSLNKVWIECCRILKPGCKIVVNIGEIGYYLEKKNVIYTAIFVDIFKQFADLKDMGFIGKILWCKGIGPEDSGYQRNKPIYGSYPYPPNLLITNATENLMVWRKKGKRTYRDVSKEIAEQSKIDKHFVHEFTRPVWYIHPARHLKYTKHPAVFPPDIPERFIKAYSFVEDVVFDPFIGIGTTAHAAKKLKRNYLGIDLNCNFIKDAEKGLEEINTGESLDL